MKILPGHNRTINILAFKMRILITICARGGSKGIPGKNIRILDGKPLIGYSIETARKFAEQKDCIIGLSTDSNDIKEVAREFGVVTEYTRPAFLATDSAGKVDTIRDILLYEENKAGLAFDYILDLDVTSPLRTIGDLEEAFVDLLSDKEALNLFSVSHANKNPYFNMVERKEDGYYGLVKKGQFLSRQTAPPIYELNASFYFYRRSFFEQELKTVITDFSLVYPMKHICFDLDHEIDFEFLSFLLENNKLSFFK